MVPDDDTRFYFVAIDNARFRKPVEPGDQLMLKVTVKRAFKGIWKFDGVAEVDGQGSGVGGDDGGAGDQVGREQGRARREQGDDRCARGDLAASAKSRRTCRSDRSASSGPDVEIGAGTWIGPHAVINGPTRIGKDNKIFQFASLGDAPQDKKYKGEPTRLEIGDRNVFREFVTVNRGTIHDQRRDPHRQRQFAHGLFARRARLPARR